jgi:4-aminobutyrate aminotransferase-like enzyme
MGRIIIANRRGHQVIEWDTTTDTEEARARIAEAERILEEARSRGCLVSKKVNGQHVIDDAPFDPTVPEYQIIAPIAGG